MRILYVSQYYPPEIGAPAARVSELSKRWVAQGHDVTVLTGFPNHPTGQIHPTYKKRFRRLIGRERHEGVDVVRTWLWPLPNRKPIERILNYSSFFLSAIVRGLFIRRPDIVIGSSPQLLVGLSAWVLGRAKRTKVVLEVRDVWPDAILASGVSHEGSRLARALTRISTFLYARVDHIVTVGPGYAGTLIDRYDVPDQKVSVVNNGVEIELFDPSTTPAALGLDAFFVVAYVGTVGFAHGLGTIIEAATELRGESDVVFLIVGEGAERKVLEDRVASQGLSNVRFLGQRPRGEVPGILNATDACLVLLKRAEIFKTVIPTKMLEFMAAGKPVIVGVDGEARRIVEEANGGIYIEPEDSTELVAAIKRLKGDAALAARLGEGGRRYIEDHLTRAKTAADYVRVLNKVITG